jgi:CRP/FNR family transcriptional regulator, cyclic AMP receptor protein
MLQLLSYLFDIRRNEWRRVLVLYAMGMIFLVGITWGETIVEASFLSKIGVGVLSYVFIADAIATICAAAIYTLFVDRIPHGRLLVGIMVFSTILVVGGRVLVAVPNLDVGYPFLYLASRVVKETFILHWWTYVNSFYDTQSAKRIVPFIATGARIAGIIAGLSMSFLTTIFAPENIVLLWVSTLVMVALGAVLMPRLVKDANSGDLVSAPPVAAGQAPAKKGVGSYVGNVREGFRFVTRSPFLIWMAISTLILAVIVPLTTFQTSKILIGEFKTPQEISSWIGNLTGITNLIMLPFQLFFLSRIIKWMGLGNTNLIFPLGTLGTIGALVTAPLSLLTAGVAYFYRTTFRTTFRLTIDNLLFNAVPLRVKGRARAFINGFLAPIGSLIGGLILLAVRDLPDVLSLLGVMLMVLGVLYMLVSIVVRRQYAKALVSMLEQEDYSFLLTTAEDLTMTSPETLERLKKQAEESTSPEFTIFVAKLISDVGGKTSLPTLIQMARAGNSQVKAAITNIIVAADFRSSEVQHLLSDMLVDPEGSVRNAAVAGLGRLADAGSDEIYTLALELLKDPEPDVRLQVIPILIRSGDLFFITSAMQALSPLLNNEDSRWRAAAVRVLAQFNDARFIRGLANYMDDTDDEVRLEAVLAIEILSERAMPRGIVALLEERVSHLLHDPVERIRRAALTILGRLKTPTVQPTLISFLTDSSPEIRDTAVRALVRASDPVTLTALAKIDNSNPQLRKMATVVVSNIDRDKSLEAIRAYIRADLVHIYANNVRLNSLAQCTEFRGIAILCDLLRERNIQHMEDVFYLLTAIHNPQAVKVIAESLNNQSALVRANAFEAIEPLLGAQLLRLFTPLFDLNLKPADLLAVSREHAELAKTDAGAVLRGLGTDQSDAWVRAIVNYALGEIGATAYPPKTAAAAATPPAAEAPAKPPEKPKAARRERRGSADLLGALEGNAESKPAANTEPEKKAETQSATPAFDPSSTANRIDLLLPSVSKNNPCLTMFNRIEIEAMLGPALNDTVSDVRLAARAARRMMSGIIETQESYMLSTIEKIIFLKEVPFFEGMTVDQLKILASVCEEEIFAADAQIFNEGDSGGILYVIVRGRVALEREGARKGSTARIGTVEALSYFGEMTLFDQSPRTERAIALIDTLTLRLRREPLLALIRQYPDLSLKLINVLSRRLRESTDKIASLTTVRPRELHKVFDKLE